MLANIPLMLAAVVADGRPLDLLRADQIRDPAAAPAAATRCSAAPALSRPGPISRSCSERSLPACSRRGRSMPPLAVLAFAVLGFLAGRQVPPAPPPPNGCRSPGTSSTRRSSWSARRMHIRRLFLAILAISFFWTIGAVLIIIFPPLVKNVLGANEQVASLFIAIFSIGIAIGSVAINRLLKSEVSARFAPASVIAHGRVRPAPALRRPDLEQASARTSRRFGTSSSTRWPGR